MAVYNPATSLARAQTEKVEVIVTCLLRVVDIDSQIRASQVLGHELHKHRIVWSGRVRHEEVVVRSLRQHAELGVDEQKSRIVQVR
jgi:hypothetical protein